MDTALRATELPYSETPGAKNTYFSQSLIDAYEVSVPASPEHEMDIAESWIGAITNATMKVYFQKILEIDHFSHHGAQQLSTDIGKLIYLVLRGSRLKVIQSTSVTY